MKTNKTHFFRTSCFQARARWLGVLVLVAGVGSSALAQSGPIATAPVQAAPLSASYALEGVIQPVKQSTVSAQTNGRVTALAVKAGDAVRKGQLLATIDDREAAVGVQHSQAQIQQADAELRNAKAHWQRTQDLQAQGFVSKAALDTADAQFKSAQAQREQAGAAARQSGLAQGFTRLQAPFDGYVLQTHIEVGDLATPGKPLLTIYAPVPMRAVVQVPASRAQWVRTATAVQVLVAADGVPLWVEPVTRSAVPTADPVSQTTEWRLELTASASAQVVPGQQTRVRFTPASAAVSTGLTVPEIAIMRRGELTAVYVATGNTFALRAVRLGTAVTPQGVEVLAGLRAGERVALDPIRAGMPNAIVPGAVAAPGAAK